jgi:isopropylmalate/homocitrate/citramalate synthase
MPEESWVSPFNFIDEVRSGTKTPAGVGIYDVTLRDGEQTPGVVFRKDEKVRIAEALNSLGVKRIEAGMPVVSQEDKSAIKEITHLGLDAEIWGFCRCMKSDIDACLDVDVDAVICEVATSDLKFKAYNFDQAKVTALAVETLNYAKEHGLHTAFFPVDMTRANVNFLKTITTASIKEGHADELVAVDTLGVALPEAMYYLVRKFKEWFHVPIHVHCHNDFGLSTACTLAAIRAGAEWAHVSVNGLGEKAGNTDLSELALSLYLLCGIDTGIEYRKLVEVSKLVQKLSGLKMPPHKPVVGKNVFRRESGVTVLQLIAYPPAVESFAPEMVGGKREIVLGKKSGRHSIEWKLKNLGVAANEEQIGIILNNVKTLGTQRKGLVSDKEFRNIVNQCLK